MGYDTRFYSEEFSALAVAILQQYGIRALLCDTFAPTPAVAYEIQRSKLDGAVNLQPSHNPAQYRPKILFVRMRDRLSRRSLGYRSARRKGFSPAEACRHRKNSPHRRRQSISAKTISNDSNSSSALTRPWRGQDQIRGETLSTVAAGYLNKILADHGVSVRNHSCRP